jgi:dephospho-CoA kinase
MKIGLAGGIGSGKSYVAARLLLRGIKVYDCDSAAKRLMRTSTQLREQLTALIGADCYESDGGDGANGPGRLNKAAVSRFLLASPTNQQAINAIVHPAVFADFEESGLQWLESGIMFESGANRHVDRVIVVTAPKEVRLQRIMQRDGISREQAQQWIACQWPQSKVRRLADYEIVNDGQQDIDKQLNIILEQLCNKPF